VISVGWFELGDVTGLDRGGLRAAVDSAYPILPNHVRGLYTRMLWDFCHEISPGDVVIARRGTKRIAAIGVVRRSAYYDAEYDRSPFPPGDGHRFYIDVEWRAEPRDQPVPGAPLAIHTLYEPGAETLERLAVGTAPAPPDPAAAPQEEDTMDAPIAGNEGLDEIEEDESTLAADDLDIPEGSAPERRKIFTDKSDPPIAALHMRYQSGDLVLAPLFQRRKVWEDARASRLIESVLLEVPLPVFYLAEGADGTEEVIDGQQRLNAFFRFLDNEYPLRGLRALPHLNGLHFRNIDRPLQKLVRESSIRTITFKKESDDALRFEIFERLNTGAVPLNRQELRNCVYRGPYNKLLIDLSEDADYRVLMGLKGPEKRMRDVEYVLRFAAFFHATYLKYKSPMARFLDEDMKKHQRAGQAELEELRTAFKTSVALVRSLLGQNAFKRFHRGTDKSPGGHWEQKKFNASLFDILMWSLAGRDKNQIMAKLDSIREALIVFMTEDQDFIDSIELSTSAAKMVLRRFDKWRLALDAILQPHPKQARLFTRELKQELFLANPTCAICGQHISDLDDAAVDHIKQYWMGGRTIPANARLTHRYCNSARPRADQAALNPTGA
jgi:hypothetical protein